MPSTTIAIYGATGETGRSIIDGLLESSTEFTITALSRSSSIVRPENQKLRERGITVVACDVHGPLDNLVQLLKDMDVVICSLSYLGIEDQRPLAKASRHTIRKVVPRRALKSKIGVSREL
ncbi:hypothetical protein ETB97_006046 [Aspergillus alliaceus]|uniref:NmrA-like domain-containing protein n=1 Tax=Petromyces alliaceus TaxID=209559 RepID=A0A8H6A0M7_PETAA|nr:hypothetical protein ETB97_006046 [Aspergillus burnettii]